MFVKADGVLHPGEEEWGAPEVLYFNHGFVPATEAHAKLRGIRKPSDWRKGKEQNWQPYEEHGQLPHRKRMNVPLCALSLPLEINA